MLSIEKCAVPPQALLSKYSLDGMYADSFRTEIIGQVPLAVFVFAFYTTWLFKIEQFILAHIAQRPSNDIQARELADGAINKFAAWNVESRNDNQLLMCDMLGRTRSWFMVNHMATENNKKTHLYFGSAVVPKKKPKTGKSSLGIVFLILLGFHKIYSFLLLYLARQKVARAYQQVTDLHKQLPPL
ncbi:MAG: hypothetical protein ABI904_00275 [Chloroflexota bacterium]